MLDLRTQSKFIDAGAVMMRSAVTATASMWSASACKGMSLWVEAVSTGAPRIPPQPWAAAGGLWPPLSNRSAPSEAYGWSGRWLANGADWTQMARAWPGASFGMWAASAGKEAPASALAVREAQPEPSPAAPPPRAAAAQTFPASYRSAGGHAVAQVIVLPVEELAELAAKTVLSPVQTMLGFWRTALGA